MQVKQAAIRLASMVSFIHFNQCELKNSNLIDLKTK